MTRRAVKGGAYLVLSHKVVGLVGPLSLLVLAPSRVFTIEDHAKIASPLFDDGVLA